jgi:hypothetical protein
LTIWKRTGLRKALEISLVWRPSTPFTIGDIDVLIATAGAYTRWYWHLERSSPSMGSEYCYGLEDALEGLGISTREDDWVQIDMKHEKPFPSPPVDEQAYLVDGEAARVCILASYRTSVEIIWNRQPEQNALWLSTRAMVVRFAVSPFLPVTVTCTSSYFKAIY